MSNLRISKKGMGDNFDKALEAEGYTEDTFKDVIKIKL